MSARPRSHRAARGRRRREAACGQRERWQRRRAAGRRRGTRAVPTAPRWSGRSTQNQCSSSWTAARKSAAASAAGIPMRAPRPTRRRARSPDMDAPVSGELTRGRAPPRRTRSARTEAPGTARGSAPAAPPAAPGRAAATYAPAGPTPSVNGSHQSSKVGCSTLADERARLLDLAQSRRREQLRQVPGAGCRERRTRRRRRGRAPAPRPRRR